MNNIKFPAFVIIALSALLSSGCCKVDRSAKKVADDFTKAFVVDFDMNRMLDLSVGLAREDIEFKMAQMKYDDSLYANLRNAVLGTKISYEYDRRRSHAGKTSAKVYYKTTSGSEPGYKDNPFVQLEKRAGMWKVVYYEFDL